jgi:hypothetical protein
LSTEAKHITMYVRGVTLRRLTLVFSLVATVATVGASSAAGSHSWGNYHWARTANPFTLMLGDNMTSDWDSYLSEASSDWSRSSVLDTTIVSGGTTGKKCRATTGRVEVCNAAYGFRGWIGLAQIWVSGDGHIAKALAKMNDSYFSTPTYNKPEAKQSVLCQEVGHVFGLDHQSEDPKVDMNTCMDYYEGWNQDPNAHDYEQLELIYAHLDSTTTVFASATNDSGVEHVEREDRIKDSTVVEHLSDGSKRVTHILWALPGAPH